MACDLGTMSPGSNERPTGLLRDLITTATTAQAIPVVAHQFITPRCSEGTAIECATFHLSSVLVMKIHQLFMLSIFELTHGASIVG